MINLDNVFDLFEKTIPGGLCQIKRCNLENDVSKLYCNLAGLVSKVYLSAVVDGAVG